MTPNLNDPAFQDIQYLLNNEQIKVHITKLQKLPKHTKKIVFFFFQIFLPLITHDCSG